MQRRVGMMGISSTAASMSGSCQRRAQSENNHVSARPGTVSAARLAQLGLLVPRSAHDVKLVKRYGHVKPGPALGKEAKEKIDKLHAMAKEAEEAERTEDLIVVKKTPEEMASLRKIMADYGYTEEQAEAHMKLPPKVVKMYPGDWFCAVCDKMNTMVDLDCRACYTPKGMLTNSGAGSGPNCAKMSDFSPDQLRPEVEMKKRLANGQIARRDDWKCSNCTTWNRKESTECRTCDMKKKIGVRPGDWTCPFCQARNFAAASSCLKCRTTKGSVIQAVKKKAVKSETAQQTDRRRQRLLVLLGLSDTTPRDEHAIRQTVLRMKKLGVHTDEKEVALRAGAKAVLEAKANARRERTQKRELQIALRAQYREEGIKLNKKGLLPDGTEPVLKAKGHNERQPDNWDPPVALPGGGTLPHTLGNLNQAPNVSGQPVAPKEEAPGGVQWTRPMTKAQRDREAAEASRKTKLELSVPGLYPYATGGPGSVNLQAAQAQAAQQPDAAQAPAPAQGQQSSAETAAANAAAEAEWNAAAPAMQQQQRQGQPQPPPAYSAPTGFPQQGGQAHQDPAPPQRGFGNPAPQQRGFGAPAAHQQHDSQAQAPPPMQRGFGAPPAQQARGFGAPAQHQGQQQGQQQQQQQRGFGAPPAQQRGFGAPPQDYQQQQQGGQQQYNQQQQQGGGQQQGYGQAPPQRGFGQRPGGGGGGRGGY